MNIRECYTRFGGDIDVVIKRIGKEERVVLCAKMFKEGNDYQLIEESFADGKLEEMFLNVHNLKGVSLNLGFTPLYMAADVLCEALRPGNPPVEKEEIEGMLKNVKDAYDIIIAALDELD